MWTISPWTLLHSIVPTLISRVSTGWQVECWSFWTDIQICGSFVRPGCGGCQLSCPCRSPRAPLWPVHSGFRFEKRSRRTASPCNFGFLSPNCRRKRRGRSRKSEGLPWTTLAGWSRVWFSIFPFRLWKIISFDTRLNVSTLSQQIKSDFV